MLSIIALYKYVKQVVMADNNLMSIALTAVFYVYYFIGTSQNVECDF